MDNAIEIRGVSKTFGTVKSLEQLDLTVESGSVFGFLGANGAGKTTTLRILLGLVRADQGTLRVLGLDPARDGEAIRRKVGVLLDHDGLYGRLSAESNLEYYARIHQLPETVRAARIKELLGSLGLWERRKDNVVTWSKGMRQKLAIARALIHRPKLVFLDEPFTGLDPLAASELRSSIVELARNEGVTVVLTTHDLAHVEKACDRVAVIRKGRVVVTGAPSAIGGEKSDVSVKVSGKGITEELLAELVSTGAILSFSLVEDAAVLVCGKPARAALGSQLFQRGVEIVELVNVEGSLEDTVLSIMSGGGS